MTSRRQLHVRLDERDLRDLEALAEREGVSVAFIVRRLVRSLLRPRSIDQNRTARDTTAQLNNRAIE
jgi:hypothetical protein